MNDTRSGVKYPCYGHGVFQYHFQFILLDTFHGPCNIHQIFTVKFTSLSIQYSSPPVSPEIEIFPLFCLIDLGNPNCPSRVHDPNQYINSVKERVNTETNGQFVSPFRKKRGRPSDI